MTASASANPLDKALESLMTMWSKGITASVADVQRTAAWFGCDYGTLITRYNAYCKGREYQR